MSEDTTFLLALVGIIGVYTIFAMIGQWFRNLFGISGSSGGGGSRGNYIKQAFQRGDKIEIVNASGHSTLIDGYLQGWSQDMVSFTNGDQNGSYDKNGNYTFYH